MPATHDAAGNAAVSITPLHIAQVPAARPEDTPGEPGTGKARPLTAGELKAAKTVAALASLLGVLGFANSFRAVARAAQPSFGPLAPTVPVGIDLGIAVFCALDIVLARLDMRPRWVRLVPWTLTAATIYLNVAGQASWFGRVAHAVFPALWVVAVSVAAHVIRIRAHLASGTAMDRIRPSRWLLAPLPTARLMRRMVLWEIRSYPDALRRERARVLALTGLQDTYGPIAWRWRAPRRVRALYRLGELAPAPATPDPPPDQDGPRPAKARVSRSRARPRPARRPGPDVSDLMPLGWQAAAALTASGKPLTRDTLAAALRAAGQPAGNGRVGALLTRLRTETPPATAAAGGATS